MIEFNQFFGLNKKKLRISHSPAVITNGIFISSHIFIDGIRI